jgi:hypothetical protein
MLALLPATLLSTGLLLDGFVRGEARDGATVAGQDPRAGALTLELNGKAAGPDAVLLFGLFPSGVLSQQNQVFARGFLEVDLRLGRNGWLRARQRGGYGTADLSPVALPTSSGPPPATPPPVGSQTFSRFVHLEESSSTLELDLLATRRLRLLASAAWNVGGGVDSVAAASMPLARGPQGRALLEWAATRIDTLKLEATASDTRYSTPVPNQKRVGIGTVTAGWRTLVSSGAEVSLVAGGGAGRALVSGSAPTTTPYAVASADLRLTAVRDFAFALGTALEPSGDPLTGDLIERGSLRGSAVWGAKGKISLGASVAGSLAATSGSAGINGVRAGDQFLQGELILTVPVTRDSSVDIGGRGSMLSRPLAGQPDKQGIAFIGYTARLPLLP